MNRGPRDLARPLLRIAITFAVIINCAMSGDGWTIRRRVCVVSKPFVVPSFFFGSLW